MSTEGTTSGTLRMRRRNGKSPDKETVRNRLNVTFLLFLLLVVGAGFFLIVRIFVVPVVLATTLTILFYPLYLAIRRLFGGRRNLSSFTTLLVALLIIIIPLYLVVYLVAVQLIDLIKAFDPDSFATFLEEGSGILAEIERSPFGSMLGLARGEIVNTVRDLLSGSGELIGRFVNRISSNVLEIVTTIFVTLFSMFYFFRDGESIVARLIFLSPLRPAYEEMISERFVLISRATIQGTLIIGLIQGALGALMLLILGIPTWLLWGIVMVILAVIPLMGPWLVLLPIAVIEIAQGHVLQGIIIIAVSTLIVSTVDNFIRPRLVGHSSKLHDLLIFFSTLGGISVFGVMGFIIGPMIAALFITILEIYGIEFNRFLVHRKRREVRASRRTH